MSNLLIVQIINSLSIGGAENIAKNIALNLPAKIKSQFIIFEKKIDPSTRKEFARKNIRINQVLSSSFLGKQIATYRILRKIKPQLVHTHLGGLSYSFLPARLLGIPVVHTIHSPIEGKNITKLRCFHRFAYRFGAIPVAVSSETNKAAREIFKLQKIITIFNGVEINNFDTNLDKIKERKEQKLPVDKIILINVGNLKPIKNQKLIIDAVSRINNDKLFLLILGRGEAEHELIAYAKDQGVKNFKIVKNCTNVAKFLLASDIFVLSSKSEGLPLSLLEAMAAKIPIISTNVGEMKKILVDHENAIVVKSNNVEELTSAISELMANKKLQRRISLRAKKLAKNKFSLKNMVKLYCNLYLKLIGENFSI